MLDKSVVLKECERANVLRKVSAGKVESDAFFRKVDGDLLMSGKLACNTELLTQMTCAYIQKADMPTLVLTSHSQLMEKIKEINQIHIFDNKHKDYHPMYGMNEQQICRLIRLTSEELGCTALMDKILLYGMALMEIVQLRYPLSLPALTKLLELSDEEIAELALEEHLSFAIVENIRGNLEAGLLFRRIMECLNKTFEYVSEKNAETQLSLSMLGQAQMPHAAFYIYSKNQKIMNTYLKEELYLILENCRKLRVIVDEILVTEDDEFLKCLHEMKRVGSIELIWCSENARDVLTDENMNFSNICLFTHASVAAMERVSEVLFGKYLHHYPVQTLGRPPRLIFTFKRDEHWTIHTEERLRVRTVDLLTDETELWKSTGEKLAIKIGQKENVFLVPLSDFINS